MRIFKFSVILCCIIISCSCKKNSDPNNISPNFYMVNGGAGDTDKTLLLFSSSDTLTYNVVISSSYYLSSPALISIGVSDQSRDAFNTTYGTSYQAMPANAYSFRDTITSPIGSVYDTISVSVYKHALTPDQPYMLPLQIISAGGYPIDPTSSIIYLHTSNSSLSGVYNSTGIKIIYNGDAADSSVNSSTAFSLIKNLIPGDDNTSLIDYADLGANGWQYIIGYSNDDSSFYALPNDVIKNSVQSSSFKVLAATYDSTTNNIYLKTSYKNTNGDERIVEESLTLH